MEDNAMRTATETQEDDTGGMLEIWDNGDGRQGQQQRQRRMRTVVKMRDNRDGYGSGGDAEQQQKIYGTTEMAELVGRTATHRENIDRERLPN